MTLPGYMTDKQYRALRKPRICGYTGRELAGLATFYLVTLAGGLLLTCALVNVWRAM